jgi:hypothetical protein
MKILDPRKIKGKKLEGINLYLDGRAIVNLAKHESITTGNTIESMALRGSYEAKHNFPDLFEYYCTRDSAGTRILRKALSVYISPDLAPMIDDIKRMTIGWSSNLNGLCLRIETKSGAYFRLTPSECWWIDQDVPYNEPAQ